MRLPCPVERLWDVTKDRICNRAWEDLEALTAAINEVLAEYWSTPRKVRSLIGEGWLLWIPQTLRIRTFWQREYINRLSRGGCGCQPS